MLKVYGGVVVLIFERIHSVCRRLAREKKKREKEKKRKKKRKRKKRREKRKRKMAKERHLVVLMHGIESPFGSWHDFGEFFFSFFFSFSFSFSFPFLFLSFPFLSFSFLFFPFFSFPFPVHSHFSFSDPPQIPCKKQFKKFLFLTLNTWNPKLLSPMFVICHLFDWFLAGFLFIFCFVLFCFVCFVCFLYF